VFLCLLMICEYTPTIVRGFVSLLEEVNSIGSKLICMRTIAKKKFWKALQAQGLLFRAIGVRFTNTLVNFSASSGKFMTTISWALTVLLFTLPVSAGIRCLPRGNDHRVHQKCAVTFKHVGESSFGAMPTSTKLICQSLQSERGNKFQDFSKVSAGLRGLARSDDHPKFQNRAVSSKKVHRSSFRPLLSSRNVISNN
jgi:hypothetical protein